MSRDQVVNIGDSVAVVAVRPRKRVRRSGIALRLSLFLYGLVLAGVSFANFVGPERWWFGSANLYLPQWPWLLPCALLVPWCLVSGRRLIWIPLLMAAWVAGPIMGWSFGPARVSGVPPGLALRVMTYNVKWGMRDPAAALANIQGPDPDIIVLQDSVAALEQRLSPLKRPGWHIARLDQYTVLSRYPILRSRQRWLARDQHHDCLECAIAVGDQRITLFDVHLMTPRFALASLVDNGTEGTGDMQQNAALRIREATALAALVRSAAGPVIVAGDMNAPVHARACRILTEAHLRDAFSEAGWGYGYTYGQSTRLQHPFVRIDHLMVSPQWAVAECRVGGARGSDHSPVWANLVLPAKSEGAN